MDYYNCNNKKSIVFLLMTIELVLLLSQRNQNNISGSKPVDANINAFFPPTFLKRSLKNLTTDSSSKAKSQVGFFEEIQTARQILR